MPIIYVRRNVNWLIRKVGLAVKEFWQKDNMSKVEFMICLPAPNVRT